MEQIDAALPFLSFAAGLMAAAEMLKLALPGYPFSKTIAQYLVKAGDKLAPRCSRRERAAYVNRAATMRFTAA